MTYLILLALAAAAEPDGATSINRLLACEATTDAAGRLACYDAEVRTIRGLRAEAAAAIVPPQARRAAPTRPPAFVPVASTIREVTPLRPGFWRVILADDSEWQNSEWTDSVPRSGKPIAIRKGALGSLWAKTDAMPDVRVRRAR